MRRVRLRLREEGEQAVPLRIRRGAPAAIGDLRFRTLVGEADWARLPATTRARFSHRLAECRAAVFSGRIVECRMSRCGWVLAQLGRLIGGPLPISRAVGVAAAVAVTEDFRCGGQFWTRVYGRQSGVPQVIRSSKRFAGPTGLTEHIGCGFAIALNVAVTADRLDFISDHYLFCGARLPTWLSPGRLRVSHVDFGNGAFDFQLVLQHPRLGELVRQTVHFQDHPVLDAESPNEEARPCPTHSGC